MAFIALEVALGHTGPARALYKRCFSRAMDVEGAQLALCQVPVSCMVFQ